MSIILTVYLVIQVLVLSSLMVLEIDFTIHAITMALACVAYFVVAFKNPGYFQGQQKSAPSLQDEIKRQNQVPSDEKIIKQMDEEQENNDKSQLDNHQNLKNQQFNNEKILEHQADSMIKKSQIDEEIQQKFIQAKFPQYSTKNMNKISQVKTNQVDVILKKSSTQIPHRYCRICKVFQPYRVRHCNECQKCICTFDHHCPWMNNCIGQKNRNVFWIYLLLQFIEFLLVLIDVGQKALEAIVDKGRVYFFAVSILFVTIVALLLLVFHTYLMLKNFTTWEYVRWDRINYLSIYSYKKSSPFSYGFVRNITDYFFSGKASKQWTISPQFLKLNKEYQQQIKQGNSENQVPQIPKLKTKVTQKAQTERAIISSFRP